MRQDLALRRVNRIFDDFFSNRLMPVVGSVQGQVYINTDIIDKGDAYEVKAEMPGVDKNNVEVEIDARTVRLTVKTSSTKEEHPQKNYLLKEIISGSTSRSFGFNELLDSDNSTADFKDGVLVLHIPKKHVSSKKLLKFDN